MSFEAMQTGITGIQSISQAMAVVSDNIANVNTSGFKSNRALFADVLSQNLGENKQIGRGVSLSAVTRNFGQAAFETTDSATDMAIDGNGFFVVKNNTGQFYTRAGAFQFDNNDLLTNTAGMKVQGFQYNSTTQAFSTALSDISLAGVSSQPKATAKVTASSNVDSRSTVPGTAYVSTNITPSMYNHSSSVTVYDSLGNPHQAQILFRKTATANTWDWHLAMDGSNVTGGTTGQLQEVGTGGQVGFTTGGLLNTESGSPLTVSFTGGAAASQAVAIDFGTSIVTDSGKGTDGTTQFAVESSTIFMSQDGFGSGSLQEIRVDRAGVVSGSFTNGRLEKLARVALASFSDPQSMEHRGANLFSETLSSGPALIGAAGTGKLGAIASNSLETSNVDLATQFVELINLQRSFQANSRAVTTSSQLIAEVINIGG
jgi:flagellar hook protein FlgE